jgi:RHS repeat-associated protein
MGNVTALEMDVITEKSGHSMTGLAVSVCLTPAAPSPLPIPYPTMASVAEGVIDECMRTKIDGAKVLTVGSCTKNCHGNEPGTLKEVVSLNTTGPCFPILGAPIVFIELGMAGITLSPGFMNKNPVPGGGGSASGAGGGGGGGGGAGGGAGGPGGGNTQGSSNGGGGGGGKNSGAAPPKPPAPPGAQGQASGGHPIDVVTGALFTTPAQDFVLAGFVPVRWIRTYMSSSARRDVGFGFGWSCSLHWTARRTGDRFTLVDEDGRSFELPPIADGETAVLPYGRSVRRAGDDLVVALGDDLERVLRPGDDPSFYRLVELRDRFGHAADIEWEGAEIAAIVDSVGRRAIRERDGGFTSWTAIVTDEAGAEHRRRLVMYEQDARGDLVRVTDAGGVTTRFEYDEEHYLVSETRPDGLRFVFRYEEIAGEKRCVETWGELPGRDVLAEMSLDGAGTPGVRGVYHTRLAFDPPYDSRLTDALGNVHGYEGNALGLVERHVEPRGYLRTLRYDAAGRLLSVREGAGAGVRRSFDGHGRLAVLSGSNGEGARIRYGDAGLPERLDTHHGPFHFKHEKGLLSERRDPDGTVTELEHDEHGRVVKVTLSSGETETMAYDAHGNLIEFVGRAGERWRYTFDLFGAPVRIETPAGAVFSLQYDSRGLLVGVDGPTGRTEHDVDGLGRIVTTRHPNGGLSRYRYVGDALVERTYPDGTRYRMGYDALSRLVAMEAPTGERHQLWYDPAGNLAAERTLAGLLFRYEHDGNNQLHRIVRPDESVITLRREASERGTALVREHSNGAAERFEYDAAGRLVRAQNRVGSVEWVRDEVGRVTREVQTAGGFSFAVDYAFGEHGELVKQRYSTGWEVRAVRGAGRRVEELCVAGQGGERVVRFERDAMGHEIARRCEAVPFEVKTERDALGRPTKIHIERGGEDVRERAYTWSDAGPVERIDDSARGRRSYALDAMGRPARVVGLGASEAFSFSPLGVPLDRGGVAGAAGRPRLTESGPLLWDRAGRLAGRDSADPQAAWRYTYDENDRLVEAVRGDGLRVSYLYDAVGRRVAETCQGVTTFFGYDGGSLVEEQSTGGAAVRRVFADDGFTPLAETTDRGPFRLLVTDAAATPWIELGDDGATAELDLTTWGKVAFEDNAPTLLRFAGQRFDRRTGLSYHRARYYAPDLATFLTPDPLGIDATLLDVAFVPNVTYWVDPLGLWVAIVQAQGNECGVNKFLAGGEAMAPSTASYAATNPNAKVFSYDQLGPGSLNGATQVIVVSHGSPGGIGWGPDRPIIGAKSISGEELGQKLNAAGFDGKQPGAKVDVVSCNAGTKPLLGGTSVAQGVANSTGASTTGAVANNRLLGALSLGGTTRTTTESVNGVPTRTYEAVDRGTMGSFTPNPP